MTFIPPDADQEAKARLDTSALATALTEQGASVAITPKEFNIIEIRKKIQALKHEAGGNTEFKFKISDTPFKAGNPGAADLGLQDLELKAPKGLYWCTVGDSLNNDILIPKAIISWGASFTIVKHGDSILFKDDSALNISY